MKRKIVTKMLLLSLEIEVSKLQVKRISSVTSVVVGHIKKEKTVENQRQRD